MSPWTWRDTRDFLFTITKGIAVFLAWIVLPLWLFLMALAVIITFELVRARRKRQARHAPHPELPAGNPPPPPTT